MTFNYKHLELEQEENMGFSTGENQPLGGKGARACKSFQIPAREVEPAILGRKPVARSGTWKAWRASACICPVHEDAARQVRDRDGRPRYSRWLPEYIHLTKDKRGGVAKQLPVVTGGSPRGMEAADR